MRVLEAPALPSPARVEPAVRGVVRVGVVQHRWSPDVTSVLHEAVAVAAARGASLVVLPELTLSRYLDPASAPEPLADGPTVAFASAAASASGVWVVASLFEAPGAFNTAVLVAPDGSVAARTRKLHIPSSLGYGEREVFRPGPADDAFGVHEAGSAGALVGIPTCYDQWFPEVARAYALGGADVVAFPSAIGSEVRHPGWDTEPMWRQVMVGAAVANGLFVVAANRVGAEDALTFYGSSFACDPYGRVLVQAPRDEPAVLVADLDLDQRRDWMELFPFLKTRRPDTYATLVERAAESAS